MKNLAKILALIVVCCMLLSVCAFAAGDDEVQAAYVEYIHEWLLAELEINSTMTIDQVENEFMPLVEAGSYTEFPAEMLYGGMLESGIAMTYDEFAAQYVPGEGSGEASASDEISVEDAYIEYLHEWLIAEDEINDTMTEEIRENEFMPLIYAWDFESFPAEMLWSGMLESGIPMTFEEFAEQYVPAGASGEPSGEGYSADEAGYQAYLKDWVAANPAVQANIDEFNAQIESGDYVSFPLEMCFTDQWFGFAALTLDEFIAAGGVAEIPAFDPTLAPD